jgi:hypothetical protein
MTRSDGEVMKNKKFDLEDRLLQLSNSLFLISYFLFLIFYFLMTIFLKSIETAKPVRPGHPGGHF